MLSQKQDKVCLLKIRKVVLDSVVAPQPELPPELSVAETSCRVAQDASGHLPECLFVGDRVAADDVSLDDLAAELPHVGHRIFPSGHNLRKAAEGRVALQVRCCNAPPPRRRNILMKPLCGEEFPEAEREELKSVVAAGQVRGKLPCEQLRVASRQENAEACTVEPVHKQLPPLKILDLVKEDRFQLPAMDL